MNRCKQNEEERSEKVAKCQAPLRSVNMRPREVRDDSILLCFGDREEGGPGQANRKRRQAGR